MRKSLYNIGWLLIITIVLGCFLSAKINAQTVSGQPAQIISPNSGAILINNSIVFNWTNGVGVTGYRLDIGTRSGASDVLSQDEGDNQTATVNNLPITGSPLYVNIYSNINGVMVEGSEIVYQTQVPQPSEVVNSTVKNTTAIVSPSLTPSLETSAISLNTASPEQIISDIHMTKNRRLLPAPAQLTGPVADTITTSSVTFQWTLGVDVSQYRLDIGTSSGGNDIYSQTQGTNQSVTVNNLPLNGNPLYVNIYSDINGVMTQGTELVYQTDYQFYVDPVNGNDANSGVITQPFVTIQKALGTIPIIKSAHNGLLNHNVYIILRGGTYYVGQTIVLDSNYSGNNGNTVYIQAYPNEIPIISGGQKILSWVSIDTSASSVLWETNIPSAQNGGWYFQRLRVGSSLVNRTTYPTYDLNNPSNVLFNGWCGKPWEKGEFGFGMGTGGGFQPQKGELDWNIQTQQSGTYNVWVRYAYDDPDPTRIRSSQLLVDNISTTYPLSGFYNTGSWGNFVWIKAGTVTFSSAGAHTLKFQDLQQTNNLDALIVTSDTYFDPTNSNDFVINSNGGYTLVSGGGDLLVIQAESANNVISPAFYPSGYTASNIPVYSLGSQLCLASGSGDQLPSSIVNSLTSAVSSPSNDGVVLTYYPAGVGAIARGIVTGFTTDASGNQLITPHLQTGNFTAGDRFYLENVKGALVDENGQMVSGSANEWYLDTGSGNLYVNYPGLTNLNILDVVAPVVKTILQLQGTSSNYVSNIIIDGVQFMDTDAYLPTATEQYSAYQPIINYAVELDYAHDITIRNSSFSNLGSFALGLENSSYHNFIYANNLNNLGGGAIGIGYNSGQDTASNGNVISFNSFSNIGRIYSSQTGAVVISNGGENFVSNNNINNLSGAGVFINANYGAHHAYGNVVEYNRIINSVQEGSDMGAYYVIGGNDPNDQGDIVNYNFIKNTGGVCSSSGGASTVQTPCFTTGIYLDNYTSGIEADDNLVEEAGNNLIEANSSKDIYVNNNIFYNPAGHFSDFLNWNSTLQNLNFTHNIFVNINQQKPMNVNYQVDDNGIYSPNFFGAVDYNLYSGVVSDLSSLWTPAGGNNPGLSYWTSAGYDAHSIYNQDPLFKDPANDDFTLPSGSPAISLGFQPLPFSKMGNTGYPASNHAPVFSPLGDKNVVLGDTLQFTVSATSVDNDIVSTTVLNPPIGASFNSSTGAFSWTPTEPGTYDVGFLVQDSNGLSDLKVIKINVTGGITYSWPFNQGTTNTSGGGGGTPLNVEHENNHTPVDLDLDAMLFFNFSSGTEGWTLQDGVNALWFNKNNNDYISIYNHDYKVFPANNGSFSLSFLFKLNSLTNNTCGIMVSENYLVSGFRIGVLNGILTLWSGESGGNLTLRYPTPLVIGQWYQVEINYDALTDPANPGGTLSINNVQVDSEKGQVLSGQNVLMIGSAGNYGRFDGYIASLKISR